MESLHAVFSIAGPAVTLLGVVVSVVGTYLLTKKYHPWTWRDYAKHLPDAPHLAMVLLETRHDEIRGEASAEPPKTDPVLDELRLTVKASEVNKERGTVSLVGIDLIFIGFLLQGVGAVASLIDLVWNHWAAQSACRAIATLR
jgi:hypothetical protein